MLYYILYSLHDVYSPFNIFRYITFRTALAAITSALITFFLAPYLISRLKKFSFTQYEREDGPKNHLSKSGTPTMGGILIVVSIFISVFLWGDLNNIYIWLMLISILGYGIIGFMDDYLKITKKNTKGLNGRYKLIFQTLIASSIVIFLYANPHDPYTSKLILPFFKNLLFDLGIFYIPFGVFVIIGTSNAVNLTDGMDGLAIGLIAIVILAIGALLYISGNKVLADYLQVIKIPNIGELTVFCGAVFGASLGFLWYNCYPAEVFMGDVGSLSLGGSLGTLVVITKQEIVLLVLGWIFVFEAISVILQVAYFKMSGGKRIFRMAPIHHHFELKGWSEPKTVIRFWIFGIILALLSLATLKVR